MNSDLDKLNQQIIGFKKKIAFITKQGQSTSKYQDYLNEAITKRDNEIKYGAYREEQAEVRAKIDESRKKIEKLKEECRTLKIGAETYDKMENKFIESAERLFKSIIN